MSQLFVDIKKLKHNIHYVRNLCAEKGLDVIGVVKCCFAYLPIIEVFQKADIKTLGISRITDAIRVSSYLKSRPIMTALPSADHAEDVVRYFKASLNSEIITIQTLAHFSDRNRTEHEIILMVDNGDLREGVMPDDVIATVSQILDMKSPYIRFLGLGANMGCCSAVLPDAENILILQELTEDIEKRFGHPVQTVSVGGSVMLDWIEKHELPSKINQIRIGEAFMLGNIPTINRKHEKLYDDVLILKGTVLEVKEKPSYPTGNIGTDALGRRPCLINRGIRKRAILNFGIADTDPDGLQPEDEGIRIISANSDYTIVDVSDCAIPVKVGEVLKFKMNYRAMIQSFLSPFTRINIIREI